MSVEWGVINDASIAQAREMLGVPLRRDRMQWVEVATRDAIRQFCLGVGDDNPLWRDPDYAQTTRWGGLLAPPSFLYAIDFTIVAPKLPGVQWIYAGTRWRWFDAVSAGQRFNSSATLTEVTEKTGRRFGTWVLQTGTVEYRRENGALVATAEGRIARTPRQRSKPRQEPKQSDSGPVATKEPTAPLGELVIPPRRGADPRWWEDTAPGELIGPMIRPLAVEDIYRWYAGAQGALHYGGAHGDAVRYRHRHDDFEINPDTGAKDFAARGHFSARQGRDTGMGGAYDVGPHRIAWLTAMLTDWLGDDGFLAQLDVDILKPNLVGDTTEFTGTVTDLWQQDDDSLVAIELVGVNQRGELTTRGSAFAALPSRHNGPVVLPLLGADPNRSLTPPERAAAPT